MADQLVTLRPDGVITNDAGKWDIQGGVDLTTGNISTLTDNSDSTWVGTNAFLFPAALVVSLGTFAFPAGALIRSVQPRIRFRGAGSFGVFETAYNTHGNGFGLENAAGVRVGNSVSFMLETIATKSGSIFTSRPGGGAWTQADIDSLRFWADPPAWGDSNAAIRIYEIYADVLYNRLSTVSNVTVPAEVREDPVVSWTYTDLDGDLQTHWQAKIFHGDVVNGGGFNPSTSPHVYDSGITFGVSVFQATLTAANLSPGRYYAYVRTRDAGSDLESAWSQSNEFRVINSPLMTI